MIGRLPALLRGPEWLSRDAHIVILARAVRTFGHGCTSILLAGMLSEDGVPAPGSACCWVSPLLGRSPLRSPWASSPTDSADDGRYWSLPG